MANFKFFLKALLNYLWKIQKGSGLDLGLFGVGSMYYGFFQTRAGTKDPYAFHHYRLVGLIMILAWASQIIGAWMKRYAIAEEMKASPENQIKENVTDDSDNNNFFYPSLKKRENMILFYLLMHPIISGIFFSVGASNLFPELARLYDHWIEINFGFGVGIMVVLIITAALLPTIFVFRALVQPKKDIAPKHPFFASQAGHFVADQLIVFSFLVLFATIFGMQSMMGNVRPINPIDMVSWIGTLVFLVPLLWVGLSFFYIPYRLLLMYNTIGTWKNRLYSLLAISPIIIRYVLG